jgi:LPS-assembly lipoprotein
MLNRRTALFVCLGLAGCGFKPVYERGLDGAGAGAELAKISIPEPRDRLSQLVRNELLARLSVTRTDGSGVYRLDLTESRASRAVVKAKSGLSQRQELQVTVSYKLVETSSGKILQSGSTFAVAPYDRVTSAQGVSSEFTNVQAEASAEERAAIVLAEDLRIRLAAFFAGR